MLEKSSLDRQHQMQMQSEQFAFNKFKKENKILHRDLTRISDPRIRAITQAEQERIIRKRAQQQQVPPLHNDYGQYFHDIGGSGSDLPEY